MNKEKILDNLLVHISGQMSLEEMREIFESSLSYFNLDGGFVYQLTAAKEGYQNTFKILPKSKTTVFPSVLPLDFAFNFTNSSSKTLREGIETYLKKLFGVKTVYAVPVVESYKLIGVVGVLRKKEDKSFTADNLCVLASTLICVADKIRENYIHDRGYHFRASIEQAVDHAGVDIYVTDYHTSEILYVNKSLAEQYGGSSELLGRTCYLALRTGITEACSYCPKLNLNADEALGALLSFEYKNPENGRWYRAYSSVFEWEESTLAHVVTRFDVTEIKEKEEVISKLAFYDSLTKIRNRRRFEIDFEEVINNALISGTPGFLLFVDLDNFKHINDAYGHDSGDSLLSQVARFLEEFDSVRQRAYRYGGDEFLVLIEELDHTEVETLLDFLVMRFKEPWDLAGAELYCTASIGVAAFPQDGLNKDELLTAADKAMYNVKKSGKGAAQFSSRREVNLGQGSKTGEMEKEFALRKAITDDCSEFVILYHPMADLITGKYCGVEVLLRWDSPHYGFVLPGEFIPICENLGLMNQLDKWVFEKVLREVDSWNLTREFFVNFNVSSVEFMRENFDTELLEITKRYKKKNQIVMLELSAPSYDLATIALQITKLRESGVQVALDGFGTGYASLEAIQSVKADLVKIDRKFIITFLGDELKRTITNALVMISHAAGTKVCAGGVQSKAHETVLKKLGCDYAQGVYYSVPLSAEEFKALIPQ